MENLEKKEKQDYLKAILSILQPDKKKVSTDKKFQNVINSIEDFIKSK